MNIQCAPRLCPAQQSQRGHQWGVSCLSNWSQTARARQTAMQQAGPLQGLGRDRYCRRHCYSCWAIHKEWRVSVCPVCV